MDPIAPNKAAEIREAEKALEEGWHFSKPFASSWGNESWVKWATIAHILNALDIPQGSTVLDIGCGGGWTTCLLAEAGYRVTGVDIAPASLTVARTRAERWQLPITLEQADMDSLDLGQTFDTVMFFDSLHHTDHRAAVVSHAARHLAPHGWAIFGEPSSLHSLSPNARAVHRDLGWIERGVSIRGLKRDCRAAGLGSFRRFHEGTRPYERAIGRVTWQLLRLVAAHAWAAPQASVWLAAQRPR